MILFQEDFEGEWYSVPVGSGKMKIGWTPWFTEQKQKEDEDGNPYPWENHIPEWGHPDENDPHMDVITRSGTKCLQVSLRFATHWAGAYRIYDGQVEGDMVRFSCWGHTRYHGAGSEIPQHPGRIGMKVGIDPAGGIDPFAASVVWSAEHPEAVVKGLDDLLWVEFTVEAKAQGNRVTVFLHSNPEWAVEFVGPNWDDATLETIDVPVACYGLPRVDYSRRVHICPTVEALAAAVAKYPNDTYGQSWDDAGIGDLSDKTVVIWDYHNKEIAITWFAEHYPGTKVGFEYTEQDDGVIAYSQRELEWKDETYAPGCVLTFSQAGCLTTAVAIINSLTGSTDTPPIVAENIGAVGAYNGCLLSHPEKIPEAYPQLKWDGAERWHIIPADLDAIAEELEKQPVILEVDFVPGGGFEQHFVVATGFTEDGKDLECIDPYDGTEILLLQRYATNNWDLARTILGMRRLHVRAWWPDDIPDPSDPPYILPRPTEMRSLHVQVQQSGIDRLLVDGDLTGIKFTSSLQDCEWAIDMNPDTVPVYRHVEYHQDPYFKDDDPIAAANRWIDHFRDSLYTICDNIARKHPHKAEPYLVVESLNEEYGTHMTDKTNMMVRFDTAYAIELRKTGLPAAAGVYTAAVGNIDFDEFHLLRPLAIASKELGYKWVWWGPHCYFWARGATGGPSWLNAAGEDYYKFHAGRWEWTDDYLMSQGFYVYWYSGESGVVGKNADNEGLLPSTSWLSPSCLNGDWSRYDGMIDEQIHLTALANAKRQNRFRFHNYFTVGAKYTNWDDFQLREEQWRDWI